MVAKLRMTEAEYIAALSEWRDLVGIKEVSSQLYMVPINTPSGLERTRYMQLSAWLNEYLLLGGVVN